MPRRPAIFSMHCLACLLVALTQASFAGSAVIISFDPPGSTVTYVTGINRTGTVVGLFEDSQGDFHGFSRNSSGQITVIDIAGPTSKSQIYSINDSGEMAGYYYDTAAGAWTGFLLDQSGKLTSFNVDGAPTFPASMNASGEIAGTYGISGNLGFVRDAVGNITKYVPPNAVSIGSPRIDAAGRIAGNYTDASNVTHGYVRDLSGNFITFNAPGASLSSGRGTFVTGLTSQGLTTAGYSTDGKAVGHGFIREYSGRFTLFSIPGAGNGTAQGTFLTAINGSGAVAGHYVDSSQVSHGFIRDQLGNIQTFDDNNAGTGWDEGTFPQVMNASGQVAGIYTNSISGAGHGFIRLTK